MNDLPRFTDLRALAAEIAPDPKYRKAARTIEQAARAQSCATDLAEAESCCDALAELEATVRRRGTVTRTATEAALLRSAVTLYVRATAARAKRGERGSIQIADKLSPEQLDDHRALVALRHRSLAHVYAGEEFDGSIWHRDVLFAVEEGSVWRPGATTTRVQFNATTFARLRRQVPVARTLVTQRFRERIDALTDILSQPPRLPVEIFERHGFDPLGVFGSGEAVANILRSRADGAATFGH